MIYIRAIRGLFFKRHFNLLELNGIDYNISKSNLESIDFPKPASFIMDEDDLYHEIIFSLRDAKNFLDQRKNFRFKKEEILNYDYFFLRFGVPNIAELFQTKNSCKKCFNIPVNENRILHFKSEPKLGKKFLFGSNSDFLRILITDKERFKLLNNKWGIKSLPIIIGKKETESKNYVGLGIENCKSYLNFDNSGYGEVIKKCDSCNQTFFQGNSLELFPNFINEINFDICFTREVFIPFRRPLIVSKDFLEFLIDFGMFKWGQDTIVPLKNKIKV